MEHTAIVWFRNDLRLHDNEAISEALLKAKYVVPVYVFDTRVFSGKTSFGFEKSANFRTKFIIDSVIDLKNSLCKLGSDLIIRIGHPEEEIVQIARMIKSSYVYCNRERTNEEVKVQDNLEKNLWKNGQELRYVRGKMLYHTADLPYPVCQVPDVFTTFRKETEGIIPIRQPIPQPQTLPTLDIFTIDRGEVPTLSDFGKENIKTQHEENKRLTGGETYAIKQLNYYLFETRLIDTYKETRNNMLGWEFSSKLSPWLSTGCISPKYIYHQIEKYQTQYGKNESTYWLVFELMWRDYFRLMGKKHGNNIFKPGGIKNIQPSQHTLQQHTDSFHKWTDGMTGIPLIDANMRQLKATGFMSNRGRQNVASFLVKDLNINWLMGAEYFESLLIDYDPCSNYTNWNYITGIGNDPKEDRYFNIILQSKRYDPDGQFIKYWIPELKNVPIEHIHHPETMDISMQLQSKAVIGKDYPNCVINMSKWMISS